LLFCYLVPRLELSFDEYWAYKFAGKSNLNILEEKLGSSRADQKQFHESWMAMIEREDFLALDTTFPGVHQLLASLQARAELYLCTARQHRPRAIAQLESLELFEFFVKVLVTEQTMEKSDLIRSEVGLLSRNDWIVGDTGKDVRVGRELGIGTCAVLTGFMVKEKLQEYAPDMILGSVTDFVV
jgi:phosphoglycolate phosphatase